MIYAQWNFGCRFRLAVGRRGFNFFVELYQKLDRFFDWYRAVKVKRRTKYETVYYSFSCKQNALLQKFSEFF